MTVPSRCLRLLSISLAVLLASIELTHAFTLSYELLKPHDLDADESRTPEMRREWKRYVAKAEEFDVAPILPLQQTQALPLGSVTKPMATETEQSEKVTNIYVTPVSVAAEAEESEKVTNIYVTPVSETSSARIETTVIPNKQSINNSTANTEAEGNVVDTTPNYNETENGTTLLVKELKRPDIETTTTNSPEITTVITTTDADDDYLKASVNEDNHKSKDVETNANKTKDIDTNVNKTRDIDTNVNKIRDLDTNVNKTKVVDTTFNKTKDTNINLSISITTTPASPNIVQILTESHKTTDPTAELPVNNTTEEVPTWKKYTTIERKPANITENEVPHITERTGDLINAHTTESRVSLEKAFDLAPDILSLQELKTHLMDTTNSIQTKTDATESNTEYVNSVTEESSKGKEYNATEMVSMRAGYLDHTKPSVDSVRSSTVNASGPANDIDMGVVAYELDTHDDNEDTQNMTSHSQMVEDAMKEELLEEARMVDSIRFQTTSAPKNVAQNEILSDTQQLDQGSNQKQHEDLTVKPINYEKKTLNLYTVSPNYKPLKKIDVQPMKPFMRDPDDNSWRNESLSSLGIVFKGKNSSKAFTEVLKNKTENVMSNLLEQEKIIEKEDLRDRLEKIAEKRKSKKKKTDKFGNTEYTDYEENNSGDIHSSKEKATDTTEVPFMTSTVPSNPTKIVEWVAKGAVSDDEMLDSDADKVKTSTKSPKTNQDYYDSKDEDADYVTFPNVDILKSTPRPRVQWPVTQKILDTTQPKALFTPDRQPTVQYFPPRPKSRDENVYYQDDTDKQKNNFFEHAIKSNDNVAPTETVYTEQNPVAYLPDKYVQDGVRTRVPIDKNPVVQTPQPIHHVEYRPITEVTDDRGNFVIRHYKDLLEQVIKDADYNGNAHPYSPAVILDGAKTVKSEEYDYGQRKEELNRFVDNFNQNHERFKVDFPVVFNTSIVHGSESGKVLASSSAMYKRLYNSDSHGETFSFSNRPFDPSCENVTVELSPAYELHYYVPDQEETGDHTMPYGYRS